MVNRNYMRVKSSFVFLLYFMFYFPFILNKIIIYFDLLTKAGIILHYCIFIFEFKKESQNLTKNL